MSLDISLYYKTENEEYNHEVFESNITHNLAKMADEARIYYAVWIGGENGFEFAGDLIPILKGGIEDMEERPDYYRKFSADNGWGTYGQFLPWLKELLAACEEHPKARIHVSI